ncbi:hypothetical protein BD414DRAFT_539560 [Trametes punicea]|nr:hypothetical protein BD414DRAFT_539560 [Trametes punicea]
MTVKTEIYVVNAPSLVAAFTGYLLSLDVEERRYRDAECKLAIVQGEGLAYQNRYKEACPKFIEALSYLVGSQLKALDLTVEVDVLHKNSALQPYLSSIGNRTIRRPIAST